MSEAYGFRELQVVCAWVREAASQAAGRAGTALTRPPLPLLCTAAHVHRVRWRGRAACGVTRAEQHHRMLGTRGPRGLCESLSSAAQAVTFACTGDKCLACTTTMLGDAVHARWCTLLRAIQSFASRRHHHSSARQMLFLHAQFTARSCCSRFRQLLADLPAAGPEQLGQRHCCHAAAAAACGPAGRQRPAQQLSQRMHASDTAHMAGPRHARACCRTWLQLRSRHSRRLQLRRRRLLLQDVRQQRGAAEGRLGAAAMGPGTAAAAAGCCCSGLVLLSTTLQ